MDKPEYLVLTGAEKEQGCKMYRFLDQIVVLNKQGRAVRRNFYPSRNAAKRMNNRFGKFPRLFKNPPNEANCSMQMVPDTTPPKVTKAQKDLASRQRDFEAMNAKARHEGMYTRPGAL